jgi:methionyl-tRNA synthetase
MPSKKNFYVTTPIYYANGEPHIGSAYTTIAADVLARWNKLLGKDVFFLTGTDEHGQKIQETAKKSGKDPKEFVDEVAAKFIEAFKILNIKNDFFIRTTDKVHEKEVQKALKELYDKGYIYKGYYESYYCVGCEQYLSDTDLVDGKCPLHNTVPELRKEEAYLFKLSAFQKKLELLIESKKYGIYPEAIRREVLAFIKGGLKDISISRLKEKIYWGIELPFDKKHTCFVWVDAFWNYITGLKISKKFDKFWPPDVQLMARDIIRVHATIWPALLLALGYKLPKTLFVHGYFTIDGQKMSKSLGNVISPVNLVSKYGSDSVRYYLMRNIPFGQDGDVCEKSLIDRNNNELANKFGNLVSRVTTLAEKNGLQKCENKLLKKLKLKDIEKLIANYELDKALNEIFAFIDVCNEYVQEKKPWETGDKKILYELIDSIKAVAILLYPYMPSTSEKIAKNINFKIDYKEIKKPYKVQAIKKSEILFTKIESDKIEEKQDNKENNKKKISEKKQKLNIEGVMKMSEVEFSQWENIDLRVAQIDNAEDIPGADRLYQLSIDVGELGKRVICAGIKKYYKKEELKGKKIILFANLKPRALKGIESKGMLLAAGSKESNICVLISPEKDVPNGTKIG